jgi:hypothetical protein
MNNNPSLCTLLLCFCMDFDFCRSPPRPSPPPWAGICPADAPRVHSAHHTRPWLYIKPHHLLGPVVLHVERAYPRPRRRARMWRRNQNLKVHAVAQEQRSQFLIVINKRATPLRCLADIRASHIRDCTSSEPRVLFSWEKHGSDFAKNGMFAGF